jgi:predicted double-glycine peptidase
MGNPWLAHLAKCRKEHPEWWKGSVTEGVKKCRATYTPMAKTGASPKRTKKTKKTRKSKKSKKSKKSRRHRR